MTDCISKINESMSSVLRMEELINPKSQLNSLIELSKTIQEQEEKLFYPHSIQSTIDSMVEAERKFKEEQSFLSSQKVSSDLYNFSKINDYLTPSEEILSTMSISQALDSTLKMEELVKAQQELCLDVKMNKPMNSILRMNELIKEQEKLFSVSTLSKTFDSILGIDTSVKKLREEFLSQTSVTNTLDSILKAEELFKEQQKSMSSVDITTLSLSEQYFKEQEELLSSRMAISAFDSIKDMEKLFKPQQPLHSISEIDKILSNFNFIEKEEITEDEENIIENTFKDLSIVFPEIGVLINNLKLKKYKKTAIVIIILSLYHIFTFYSLYNDIFNNNNDRHYKTNRKSVIVRLNPTKEKNTNIITKLTKNTYIEKISSTDNGWIKVRFELEEGIEKEGYIYRTLITKMD